MVQFSNTDRANCESKNAPALPIDLAMAMETKMEMEMMMGAMG
jgi:hypothetical protein